jgi:enamine deaminase RidA (YjgF/YER057c/UK114 family)
MTGHRTIHPPGWAPARGYANGMVGRGELLAVAGQIGWDAQQRIVSDSFVEQFRQALDNVVTVVETAGGTPQDLVSLTIYVTDKREYLDRTREIGAIWRDRVGRHYPAMALVEVSALLEDAAKVEIQALAMIDAASLRG